MKISQSFIKDIIGEGYCQYFIKQKYVDHVETETTSAMENGLAFESKLIGSARDGVFEMAKKKNGEPLKRELDIDAVVDYARMAMNKSEIVINEVQVPFENDIAKGHIDALGTFKSKPVIIDVKYTGLTFAQYEKELQWSALASNLRLQALQYQYLDSEKRDFLFLVFSNHGWARFFGVIYNSAEIYAHEEVIKEAKHRFEEMTFEPTEDANVCNKCRLKEVCEKRQLVPIVEPLPI